jgi:hypothetical protein
VRCLICHKPIGRNAYRLITGLARFGQMCFCHQECAEPITKPPAPIPPRRRRGDRQLPEQPQRKTA